MNKLETCSKLLSEGRITRRQFLGRLAGLGISTPLAISLANQAVAAAEPKPGGKARFAIGHGATQDSMDPGTFQDTYMQIVGFGLRNCLTEVSNTDELIGELADSWESSPDASEWVFRLRQGVEFHNGKTMDADDVVASVTHHMGPDTDSIAVGITRGIEEVRKDGQDTVVFKLKEGNADFPYLMSDYHIPILPSKNGVADWQSGVGTGGYYLKSFDPGIGTTMTRNPNYWKSGQAHFDEVEVLVVHDSAARSNALATGEVEVIDRVDLKTAHLLQRKSGVVLEETEGALHYAYSMQTTVSPFDNNDVRLAIKYGVDRQELLDKILHGHGYVGNDHPIGKSNRYFASDIPQRSYDPEKAKFHLKKAGLDRLNVSLSAADAAFAGALDGAVLLQESAKSAGIDIDVAREPNDGYWSNVWGVKPWVASYWSGRITEDWMFTLTYAAGAPWNETKWDNKRFNSLLKAARAELDDSKRREMYREMQQICSDDGGAVIPMFSNYVFATTDRIRHGPLSAAWDLDGIKCIERWWFA